MAENLAWEVSHQSKRIKKWLEDYFSISRQPIDYPAAPEEIDNIQ